MKARDTRGDLVPVGALLPDVLERLTLEQRVTEIEQRVDRLAVRVGLAWDMAEAVGRDDSERAEVIRSDVDRLREDVAALHGRDDRDAELV